MADASRIVVRFFNHPMINHSASKEAGRPVFDDMEVCEVRMAGDRQNVGVFPADAEVPGGLEVDGMTQPCTYAEKYADAYAQFKKGEAQTKSGTPIEALTFLSPGKVRELKALNIYTAEALADLDGQPLKTLGQGGREWKNQARAYLDNAADSASATKLALENEQLREQLDLMRKEREQYKAPQSTDIEDPTVPSVAGISQFQDWDDERIKQWIASKAGSRPRGNPSHASLVQMADELANG